MPRNREDLTPSIKVWLRKGSSHILGQGGASLLKAIEKCGSISEAAKQIGLSYRYAWTRLLEMEKALGQPILRRRIGGRKGGGSKLTEAAVKILKDYDRVEKYLKRSLKEEESWGAVALKISARNRLKGIVESVEEDKITSKVKVRIRSPATITAVITREAVKDLNIKPGDQVEAVIKATEIMIAKED